VRAPLSWLRDFAPFGDDARALAATLDDLGLVVEGIEQVGEGLDEVVVAEVKEIAAIAGADRVRRVVVDAGDGPVEVVCGADNFAVGDLVPFAPVGAVLPGGVAIRRRTVRKVVSNGMLCSGRELRLSEDGAGLLVLTEVDGARSGVPLAEALGIERDVVFDLAVEANRPDASCIAGVARDLAARLGLPFALPEPAVTPGSGPPADHLASLVLHDPELCPRITARVLTQVVVGPSPRWLARRLALAGMRPVNNVVDASNYVMLELGQPTHPYDLDRLAGGGLLVRRARPGEQLETLDGVVRTLGLPGRGLGDTGEDCLICDAQGQPVGIGGVMGGASSEIAESTTRVLLESAYFRPLAIARTSRRLGLRTEASARFERGTDPWGIDRAALRVAELLADGPGGKPGAVLAPGSLDERGEVPGPLRVRVGLGRLNGLLGTTFGTEDVAGLLEPIGFACEPAGDDVVVTVPSFRPDVRPAPHGADDVVEEVARTYGYSRLPRRVPSWPQPGGLTSYQRERRRVRDVACGLGACEVWSSSFVSADDLDRAGWGGPAVAVANPLAADQGFLRRSLLPGILQVLGHNADRRQGDARLFEVGTVFEPPGHLRGRVGEERSGPGGAAMAALPVEREMLAVAFAGAGDDARTAVAAWWVLAGALRLRDARLVGPGQAEPDRGGGSRGGPGEAAADPVPAAEAGRAASGEAGDPGHLRGLHPTRAARILAGPEGPVVGAVGEVDPAVLDAFGLGGRRVGWLEVDLGLLLDERVTPRRPAQAQVVSRFPSADVDVALVVDDGVPADRVADVLAGAAGGVLESVTLFDVYRGGAVGPGRRSLAFRLRFCAPDHTLTDAEVARLRQACIDAAAAEVGATLR